MKKILITGGALSIDEVAQIARGYHDEQGVHHYPAIELSADAIETISKNRKELEVRIEAGDRIYGVNTGCGIRKDEIISTEDIVAYQKHYIPAHCVAMGEYFNEEVVRAAMILRVNSFAKGVSGVTLALCEKILEFYNEGIIPCVPQQGSVGSSGDLCLLAHVAAALIGLKGQEVWMWYNGRRKGPMAIEDALKVNNNVEIIELVAKEAMALTNGSTFTLALGILAIHDATNLLQYSHLAAALSLEAIRGELAAFDARVHEIRCHPHEIRAAAIIRGLTANSKRMSRQSQDVCLEAEKKDKRYYEDPGKFEGKRPGPRVQDAYSFRAYAQVIGSVMNAFEYAKDVFEREIKAATDNPLLFKKTGSEMYEAISGGNFHGEPLGQAADFLKIAIHQMANISDRRFYALTMSKTSYGLPSDLAGQTHPTLNTGFMILQYSTASLVDESRVLCTPSTVGSIPTSANQEDYVSMSTTAARNLKTVVDIGYNSIAAELLAAAQGISLTEDELAKHNCAELGDKTGAAFRVIRKHITAMDDDRNLSVDMAKMIKLMKNSNQLLEAIA